MGAVRRCSAGAGVSGVGDDGEVDDSPTFGSPILPAYDERVSHELVQYSK